MDINEIINEELQKLVEYLNEVQQVSDNEELQLYVDIIDDLDKNDIKRAKYIEVLKNKFNYDYVEGNDEDYINNANLNDIKSFNDFRSVSNYRKYAKKLLDLREKNVDYYKFFNYSPASISKKELIGLCEKYDITSLFKNTEGISTRTGGRDEKIINWSAGNEFPKNHILHEIGHFVDHKIFIPTTYSLTEYGLLNPAESTCDSIMLYLLNPEYYKQILPEIGGYIEKNLPEWYFRFRDDLMKIK